MNEVKTLVRRLLDERTELDTQIREILLDTERWNSHGRTELAAGEVEMLKLKLRGVESEICAYARQLCA